jgi:tRNA-2-methylthio-N6-dimethylallyladenosine synthase
MRYHITTFGCQQNIADSERIAAQYEARGFVVSETPEEADTVVINTCVVRECAAEKVFGFVRNIVKKNSSAHIVITGCLVGAASREPSGKMMKALRHRLPNAEFLLLEEVGFEVAPKRLAGKHAWLPISNGCNNFCSYCIVPFSRGREVSRSFADILNEAQDIRTGGFSEITLLGQNVNSYGSDTLLAAKNSGERFPLPDGRTIAPIMVKHLGRHRIPTLFPYLLESIAEMSFDRVSFLSSNPWDFSDELIGVIAKYPNIDRTIHLPIQSGSNRILQMMNRWYTREEYRELVSRIRASIPDVRFTTDIIVGFPGETEHDFEDTLDIMRAVGFEKAYIGQYSPRPGTKSTAMEDTVSREEKRRRFHTLDAIVHNFKSGA